MLKRADKSAIRWLFGHAFMEMATVEYMTVIGSHHDRLFVYFYELPAIMIQIIDIGHIVRLQSFVPMDYVMCAPTSRQHLRWCCIVSIAVHSMPSTAWRLLILSIVSCTLEIQLSSMETQRKPPSSHISPIRLKHMQDKIVKIWDNLMCDWTISCITKSTSFELIVSN